MGAGVSRDTFSAVWTITVVVSVLAGMVVGLSWQTLPQWSQGLMLVGLAFMGIGAALSVVIVRRGYR